jgi:hypothetical protein
VARNAQPKNSVTRWGPCGDGEHDAAYYQWGVFGDNPNNGVDPNKDEAGIRQANGDMLTVFDYKDGWQPTKTEADKEREAEEAATQKILERSREQYANALHASLREQVMKSQLPSWEISSFWPLISLRTPAPAFSFWPSLEIQCRALQNGVPRLILAGAASFRGATTTP